MDQEPTHAPAPDQSDLSLIHALRSPIFWVFTAGYGIYALGYTAITLFNAALLRERGFDPAETYKVILNTLMITGLLSKFVVGWASLHFGLGTIRMAGLLLLAAAFAGFPLLSSTFDVILFGIAYGASGSCILVTHNSIYPRAYGPTHLGRILGAVQVISVIISASGPVLLTSSEAWFGSSATMFFGVAIVLVPLAIAAFFLPLPRRQLALVPLSPEKVP